MVFIGIDYSITSPAIVVCDSLDFEKVSFANCQAYSLSDHNITSSRKNLHFETHQKGWVSQVQRFDRITNWALRIIDNFDSNDVVIGIEDYAMAAKGKVFNIAENTGILKYALYSRGFGYETFAPTVVKKFATGKGNAKKEQMVEAFQKETKIDLKKELQPNRLLGSPTTDIADAYFICKLVSQSKF
jgi:Holliday junction resolvasome RuvABC endonuclease subunit